MERGLESLALEQRYTRLVINGHIPLPATLTAAAVFLGQFDTSSLPLAVLMSPAMGETTGRRSGQFRRKTQARYRRMGARSCARRQTAASFELRAAASWNRDAAGHQVCLALGDPSSSPSTRRHAVPNWY